MSSGIPGFIFLGIFVASGVLGLFAACWGLNRRANEIAAQLEALGARIVQRRAAKHVWSAAEVQFEHQGRAGRARVLHYGASLQLIGVSVAEPALPPIALRKEGPLARLGIALRLDRGITIGDPVFDADVFVASRAPEPVVRALLASADVKRIVREVVDDGVNFSRSRPPYALLLSSDGIEAATVAPSSIGSLLYGSRQKRGWSYDVGRALVMFDRVNALAEALPRLATAAEPGAYRSAPDGLVVVPGKLSINRAPALRLSSIIMLSVVLTGFLVYAFGHGGVHRPLDGFKVLLAVAVGMGCWAALVPFLIRSFRGQSFALAYGLLAAFSSFPIVTLAGAATLFVVNATFDTGPVTHHDVRVTSFFKKNTHTVFVSTWPGSDEPQKIDVPMSIAVVQVGDALRVDSRPDLFGWAWVSSVTRE